VGEKCFAERSDGSQAILFYLSDPVQNESHSKQGASIFAISSRFEMSFLPNCHSDYRNTVILGV